MKVMALILACILLFAVSTKSATVPVDTALVKTIMKNLNNPFLFANTKLDSLRILLIYTELEILKMQKELDRIERLQKSQSVGMHTKLL